MMNPTQHEPTMQFATITEALLHWAATRPDELAFEVDGNAATWRGLADDSRRFAAALATMGVGHGSRCALVLPTSLDLLGLIFATHLRRAAPVIVNPSLSFETILRRVRRVGCHVVVVPDGSVDLGTSGPSGMRILTPSSLRDIDGKDLDDPAMPGPDDIAYLQLTSGTTGDPKAAVILHRNLAAYLSNGDLEFLGSDVVVSWIPPFHDLGLVLAIFAPVYFGARSHLLQPSLRSLRPWLEKIEEVRGTYTAAPDFAFRIAARVVDPAGLDLSSMRVAFDGGEPVRASTIREFEERFGLSRVVQPGYGLAESTLAISRCAPGDPLTEIDGHVSCGHPRKGLEVRIVDSEGCALPAGSTGEIIARGEQIFAGYLDDEEATREVLRDGWLHTGDLGMMDDEGRLYVLGRIRAMIKRAGTTIAPREIEEIADQIEGVRFSAAVGVPTDDGTERVIVVVEADRGADHGNIRNKVSNAIQSSLGFPPDDVLLVAPRTIPRTGSGKIRYGELRDGVLAGSLGNAGRERNDSA